VTTLILGKSGQLARALAAEFPSALCLGSAEASLFSADQIARRIKTTRPTTVINAAAYTAVDKAESERFAAWQLNAHAPAVVADVCRDMSIPFVHVSSDYVFDGNRETPYGVQDAPNPLSVYGATKLAGETAVRALCDQHLVIRVSWLFSDVGQNFLLTILRLAREREELRIVSDQLGRPTATMDVARLIRACVSHSGSLQLKPGTYHFGVGPAVSWFQFAREIVRVALDVGLISREPRVIPISTNEWPAVARRPKSSVLLPSAELRPVFPQTTDWRESLRRLLRKMSDSRVSC
jgi:dTDP-4-dehydrorhamnose reductase